MARFVSSQVDSDMTLKVGGDWTQPMVLDMGMPMSCGSPSYRGRMMASRRQSIARRNIR